MRGRGFGKSGFSAESARDYRRRSRPVAEPGRAGGGHAGQEPSQGEPWLARTRKRTSVAQVRIGRKRRGKQWLGQCRGVGARQEEQEALAISTWSRKVRSGRVEIAFVWNSADGTMGERKALTLMPSSIGKEPPLSLAARETGMLARRWAEAIDPWAPDTARTGNRVRTVEHGLDPDWLVVREAQAGCRQPRRRTE